MSRGAVYNLGAEREHTARSLLETLIAGTGREVYVVQDLERMRLSDVPRVVADYRRLRARTGWRAEIPFEQSLRDLLDYWRAQVALKRH